MSNPKCPKGQKDHHEMIMEPVQECPEGRYQTCRCIKCGARERWNFYELTPRWRSIDSE